MNPAYFALAFFFFGSLYGIGDSIVTLNHRQEESFWKLYGATWQLIMCGFMLPPTIFVAAIITFHWRF